MIDIRALRLGDVVRNNGSGTMCTVAAMPTAHMSADGSMYWAARLFGGGECSNPIEWDFVRHEYMQCVHGAIRNIAADAGVSVGDLTRDPPNAGTYSIEVNGVRYSAPDAIGVAELMRVYSEHVMGLGVDVESP